MSILGRWSLKAFSRLIIAKNTELIDAATRTSARFRLATITADAEPASPEAPMKLLPSLTEGLVSAFKIDRLNRIQRRVMPALMKEKAQVMCAAETGSGKTLAYLLPIMQKLKEEELAGLVRFARSPRTLVLVPSAELAVQVGQTAKVLSHHAKLRTGHLTKFQQNFQRMFDDYPLDMLIATPYQVMAAVDEGKFDLNSVRHVVLDEADSMLTDDSFEHIKAMLWERQTIDGHVYEQLQTLVMMAATVSEGMRRVLKKHFPSVLALQSDQLHAPLKSNSYVFVPVIGSGNAKQLELLSLLNGRRPKRTMIFCNTTGSASILHAYLENRLDAGSVSLVHGNIPEQQRLNVLEHFKKGRSKFIVTTDLLARGLDTLGWIDHVVMYDFPASLSQFIHRAGRVGRAGTRGHVTALVTHEDRHLAEYIRVAIKRQKILGTPLD